MKDARGEVLEVGDFVSIKSFKDTKIIAQVIGPAKLTYGARVAVALVSRKVKNHRYYYSQDLCKIEPEELI